MHEKRRYGDLILHRVSAPKSNAEAKNDASDIRMDGYRARIDTWQGGFAVWSDKGLTDTTMPTRKQRASSGVKRGRTSAPSAQREYDNVCKEAIYPPVHFSYDNRIWGWKGTAWGATAEKDMKRKNEVYTKQGYDILWLRFKGIPVLYISKWKDGKKNPKYAPEEYTKVTGHGKKTPTGVSGKLRGARAPKTITHKGKTWKLDSCHIRISEAKSFATALSDDNYTILFESGVGSYCIYTRPKSRKKSPDKQTVEEEIFSYLDRLHKAEVSREKMSSVLIEVYGMQEDSANTFVRRWAEARALDVKPATHEHRKGVSKGVYTTRAEVRTMKEKRVTGKPSAPTPRASRIVDTAIIGGKSSMVPRAEQLLGIRVDEVLAVRQFGKKNILIMVRIGKTIKLYELLRGKTTRTKHKFTEKNLLDKFSTRATSSGIERAFITAATRRGIT
jgi:hypothetical protein